MSGHIPYRPTDTAVAFPASRLGSEQRCFEQVSEYSACTVEDCIDKVFVLGLSFRLFTLALHTCRFSGLQLQCCNGSRRCKALFKSGVKLSSHHCRRL